jgi:signal transduction histidine kinase
MEPDGVAVFWPAAGISSGLLIALGPRARLPIAAAVMAATVTANLMGDRNIWAACCFALCNAAEALVTAGIIRHYFGSNFELDRLQQVLGLLLAAIAGTVLSGIGAAAGYRLFHSPDVSMFVTWRHWFLSDAVGVVSVAPLVVGLAAASRNPPQRSERVEGMTALAMLASITGAIIFLPGVPWETVIPSALLLPILLWLAARCRPVFAAAGAFMVSLTVVWTTIFGIGHFGDTHIPLEERILQAQAVILVVTLGAFVLAALFAERRRHEFVLTENEARVSRANQMLERERDNKLTNLGAAIAAVSHELRQPLTAIATKGSASRRFLDRAPPDVARVLAILDEIIKASFRANEVLVSIQALFDHDDHAQRPLDLNRLMLEALNLLHEDLQANQITVQTRLTARIPTIVGHEAQLLEVLLNLVQNSIDAMEASPRTTRILRIESGYNGNDAIYISIEDSGKGIDPQIIPNIFDAFVTTKSKGKGLGLAITKMIIERHDGRLTATSDGISGAVFELVLPVRAAPEPVGETADLA